MPLTALAACGTADAGFLPPKAEPDLLACGWRAGRLAAAGAGLVALAATVPWLVENRSLTGCTAWGRVLVALLAMLELLQRLLLLHAVETAELLQLLLLLPWSSGRESGAVQGGFGMREGNALMVGESEEKGGDGMRDTLLFRGVIWGGVVGEITPAS